MQTTATVPGRAQKRLTGLFLAVLLQVCLVFALVKGLEIKNVSHAIDHIFEVTLPKTIKPVEPPPAGPMVEPQPAKAIPPEFTFETGEKPDGGITILADNHPVAGPADRGPLSIMTTHTTPPYPALEQRLGVEGTVVLRLTISAEGVVSDAVVVRTSGDEGLDRAARQWVMAHWRYQPAIRGGVAVPATGTVGVQFNLRQAG